MTESTTHPVVLGVDLLHPEALAVAIAEARRLARPLRVVSCWSVPPTNLGVYADTSLYSSLPAVADEVLAEVAEAVAADAPDLTAEFVALNAPAAAGLLTEAEGASVVVVGADHTTWFERLLGTEVAEQVVSESPVPVIVVPDGPGREPGGAVVAAIDVDRAAGATLDVAFAQAAARGASLRVLHAIADDLSVEQRESREAALAEALAGRSEQFPDVAVERSLVESSAADAAIAATAEADLLVIGQSSRRRGLWGGRSVVRTIVAAARCPVAVVPGHGDD